MDVILPLPDGAAHIYYDAGSAQYELIARAEQVHVHHDHLMFDLSGMRTLTSKDRERLLEIRSELVDRKKADEALRARTVTLIEARLGPDDEIIRIHALLIDSELSVNRIAARAARLKEVEEPFKARRSRDPEATIRLLGDDPSAKVLKAIEVEIERLRTKRDELLEANYPYLNAIATPPIAARLLTLAGGIKSLASSAASKIQLLGAEAALFRHLKNPKQRPPKHGVIHEHPLMQRVDKSYRGRFARQLADKIAIAARVDYFGTAKRSDINDTWTHLENAAQDLKTR